MTRAEFDFSANREFDKFTLRHDLSVKIFFTDKLLTVQRSSEKRFQCPRMFVNQHLATRHCGKRIMTGGDEREAVGVPSPTRHSHRLPKSIKLET